MTNQWLPRATRRHANGGRKRHPGCDDGHGVLALSRLRTVVLLLVLGVGSPIIPSLPAADAVLPGTNPLTIERPLDDVMVEGLDRFCRRELAASRETARRPVGA